MSRVYSMMTGFSSARPGAEEAIANEPLVETPFVEAEEAPFIEIGTPGGPVYSPSGRISPAALPVEVKPLAEAKAKPEAPAVFPRIAAATAPADTPSAPVLSIRFHGVLPHAPGRPADGPDAGLVAFHFPDHPVSAEYRTLRDEITRQLPELTSRVLTFTAAAQEVGTTSVLLNLGVTLARSGQRVLALDANFNRPGVAAKLALSSSPGLAEVLGGHLPLPWALQPTAVPSLQGLVVGSASDAESAASLGEDVGRHLPKLIGQLRQWFDWVLIDAGVWGVVPERDETCSASDAVYLVTRESDADRPEFTGLRSWVKQLGGSLRGYVATKL